MKETEPKDIRYAFNTNRLNIISDIYFSENLYYFYIIYSNTRVSFQSPESSTLEEIRELLFTKLNTYNYIYITTDFLANLSGEVKISIENI